METTAVENTIRNLTDMIELLNPNWIQRMVIDIYINDIQKNLLQEGVNL